MRHTPDIRIRVLGDVTVVTDEGVRSAGPAKQCAVLAALVLSANRSVSPQTLIRRVWGQDAPVSVRGNLYAHVARLRKVLDPLDDVEIERGGRDGYRLKIAPAAIDVLHARDLVGRARKAAEDGLFDESATLWRAAAGLYRERPLGNVSGDWADETRTRLLRERGVVLEGLFAAELDRGNHDAIVAELFDAVAADPMVETLVAQLMHALYLSGRQAEALALYSEARNRFRDDLGIEPKALLKDMLHRILARDPALEPKRRPVTPTPAEAEAESAAPAAAPVEPVVPRQLPRVPAGFVGRGDVMRRLEETSHRKTPGSSVTLVTGMAGVGKTTLALQWARSAVNRFGDGQLFADLRGANAEPPREAGDVMAGFLRALGVEGRDIPADATERAQLFRSRTDGRRLLVVLDNAANVEQVRPLIPDGSAAHVLVTSRHQLPDLVSDAAQRLSVDVLSHTEALELLVERLGPARINAEATAAEQLIDLCGRLPLALRIAAANLSEWPEFALADYVRDLAEGDRFTVLSVPGDASTAVLPAFDASYRRLPEPVRSTFRGLGTVPGPTVSIEAIAALTGDSAAQITRHMAAIESAHLAQTVVPGRYAVHDLLKEYARRLNTPAEAALAGQRLFDWYNQSARAAADALSSGATQLTAPEPTVQPMAFADGATAMDWFAAEELNLPAVTAAAAEADDPVAWLLPDALRLYYSRIIDFVAWRNTAQLGLDTASRRNVPGAVAAMHYLLSMQTRMSGDFIAGEEHLRQTLTAAREAGDVAMTINVHIGLADTAQHHGDAAKCVEHCHDALSAAPQLSQRQRMIVTVLLAIGYRDLGELDRSAEYLSAHVAELRPTRPRRMGTVLAHLGVTQLAQGRLHEALATFTEVLELTDQKIVPLEMVERLEDLANVHVALGNRPLARDFAQRAWQLLQQHRTDFYRPTVLAMLSRSAADADEAVEHAEAAFESARGSGEFPKEAEARVTLAEALLRRGGHREALKIALAAADFAGTKGLRVFQGQALNAAARAQLELDRPDQCIEAAEQALKLHRATGHRPGEARSHLILHRATGLAEHRGEADRIIVDTGLAPDIWSSTTVDGR